MLKILNDVQNVLFIYNMMEIGAHAVNIHCGTGEDHLTSLKLLYFILV